MTKKSEKEKNSLSEWSAVITKLGEENREAENKFNAILDRFVESLSKADEFWFAGFLEAGEILRAHDEIGNRDGAIEEYKRALRRCARDNLWVAVQAACDAKIVAEVKE